MFIGTLQLQNLSQSNTGIAKNPGGSANAVINRFALVISNIISVLTIFAGLAFLIWFVVGALTWTTSGGQAEQLSKAKAQMGNALVGLFVTIMVIPITYVIAKLTGLDILNPINVIPKLLPQ